MTARGRSWVYAMAAVFFGGLVAFAAHAVKNRAGRALGEGAATTVAVARPEGIRIGEPITIEDLVLFPVLLANQQDPGKMTTLAAALAAGVAEVREVGAGDGSPAAPWQARRGSGGPTVNTLVIANEGDTPIYVLAGTVVKGGNQDRQIAQDFVVSAKSTVPVDAFCVEQGRWTGERDGVGTEGKFTAAEQLANAPVRAAGQYEASQGEVWAEVAKVNTANGKQKASGTLMATIDDTAVKGQREALAKRVRDALAKVKPGDELVGMAYAIGGKVKGVRWFASHELFRLFEATLASTAASDAITSRAGAAPKPPPAIAADDVAHFLRGIDQEQAEEKATRAGNVNSYKKAKTGYGSSTTFRPKAAGAAVPLSSDYVGK